MDKVPLPNDGLSVFSRQIFTINGLLLRAGNTVASASGLSVAKWHVLARANYQPRTVSEIARYLGLSRQAVQQTADSLVRDGFLRYADNPKDKRAQLATITETGANALSTLYREDAIWSQNLSRLLEGRQLDAVVGLLEPIIAALAEYMGGPDERA
jgi:DNA-binding MarR family transcriptional regulator